MINCAHSGFAFPIEAGEPDQPPIEAQALGAHWGRDRTCTLITERFYLGPNIKLVETIQRVIDSCEPCIRAKGKKLAKSGSTCHPVKRPARPFAKWGIDLIGELTEVEGQVYVCTAVCYFSKWVEAEALPNKRAATVAKFLYRLLCRYGIAEIHITDQGSEFNNTIHTEFYNLTKTVHKVTSVYHPQSNGMVERQNRTTEGTIKKFCLDNKENWLKCLDGVLFSVRCARHCSTGVSPFRAVYGFKPTLPFESNYEAQLGGDFDNDEEEHTTHEPAAKIEDDMEEMNPVDTFEYMDNIRERISQKIVKQNKKAEVRYITNYNK